jgi:hypothetical protein
MSGILQGISVVFFGDGRIMQTHRTGSLSLIRIFDLNIEIVGIVADALLEPSVDFPFLSAAPQNKPFAAPLAADRYFDSVHHILLY